MMALRSSDSSTSSRFDRYRNICKNTDKAPILLFNEADAVLGTSMDGASRAVDKMENSIQNIILQEMEKLEGIMIATTNLTSNLDKAFERRFLYKIKFEKPSLEASTEIWMTYKDVYMEKLENPSDRFRNLQKCGIKKWWAWQWANTRKGYWRTAHSPILRKH